MNKSVYENYIPKCIMVSLVKNPQKVYFFNPNYQNTPLFIFLYLYLYFFL